MDFFIFVIYQLRDLHYHFILSYFVICNFICPWLIKMFFHQLCFVLIIHVDDFSATSLWSTFFVLEVRICFVSLSVPQMCLSATCQSSCPWSNWIQLPMRRYCGRIMDETMIKNLSSTTRRRCCVCSLVQDVCKLKGFPRSLSTLSDWLSPLRSWFVSVP